MSDEQNPGGQGPQEDGGPHSGSNQQGGIGGIGQVNVPGKASFGGDFHDNSTTNNVEGTQNNVRGNQFNSGRDQFVGNRNVSTGSGGIEDYGGVQGGVHNYGGVQGGVNSGSGSQTNIRAGDISNNQGNVAVGSGINQSYSAGGQAADPKASTLLAALEDLRDNQLDDLTGDDRKSVRGPLTEAIKSLRIGQLNATTVSNALQLASDALADADRGKERTTLKDVAAAAGLIIR